MEDFSKQDRPMARGPAITQVMIYWMDRHSRRSMLTDPPDECHIWSMTSPPIPDVGDILMRPEGEGASSFRVGGKFYAYRQVDDSEITMVFLLATPVMPEKKS